MSSFEKSNTKKIRIVIIIAIIVFLALAIFFYHNYSCKRNGKTIESRELILQEQFHADYLICEEKKDGMIFSGFELSDGRTGLAFFRKDNNRYKCGQCKFVDSDVPAVLYKILDGKGCYLIFFNQPNMKYAEVTYTVTTLSGEQKEVTLKYDISDYAVICSESPQWEQPIRIMYYDKNGNEYKFVEHHSTREMYVKDN